MVKSLFSWALVLLAPLALAECDLTSGEGGLIGSVVTDGAVCLGQGPDSYTFAMITSLSGTIPLGASGGKGQESLDITFQIMDNTCKILGVYSQDSCGVPFTIKENFLKYVLTITTVWGDVGKPYFSFKYANGAFSIGNNGCVCSHMSDSFNSVTKGCRCAFPVAGIPKKREITFEA